jgi:hypothetical protein
MKKTFIALALAASVAPAWAAEVVSSNIVGYNKVTVPAGLTIVGQQFVAVGGEDQSIQQITGEGLADAGQDMIQVWNGSSYDEYYYYTEDDDINGDGTAAWGNLDWEPVDITLPAGTGMWASTQNESVLVFSGQVGSHSTISFQPGLNLVTQALPMDIDIQDITGEGLADAGQDMIQVWNGSSYDEYYYYTEDDDINGDGTAAWGNLDWEPVSVTLKAGFGFWLSTQGSGTLTFPSVNAQ